MSGVNKYIKKANPSWDFVSFGLDPQKSKWYRKRTFIQCCMRQPLAMLVMILSFSIRIVPTLIIDALSSLMGAINKKARSVSPKIDTMEFLSEEEVEQAAQVAYSKIKQECDEESI